MNERHVYIVLTKTPTVLARVIRTMKGINYSHASMAFDRELYYMFSMGRRWVNNPFSGCFLQENIHTGVYRRSRNVPCVIMEVPVTEQQYVRMASIVRDFLLNCDAWHFNTIGLVHNLIGADQIDSNYFFCSELVYYVLREGGVCDWHRPRQFVSPEDLMYELEGRIIYQGDLKKYGSGKRRPDLYIDELEHGLRVYQDCRASGI